MMMNWWYMGAYIHDLHEGKTVNTKIEQIHPSFSLSSQVQRECYKRNPSFQFYHLSQGNCNFNSIPRFHITNIHKHTWVYDGFIDCAQIDFRVYWVFDSWRWSLQAHLSRWIFSSGLLRFVLLDLVHFVFSIQFKVLILLDFFFL